MKIKEIITRLKWMHKVKDCRGICLFCEFYEQCRAELGAEEESEK